MSRKLELPELKPVHIIIVLVILAIVVLYVVGTGLGAADDSTSRRESPIAMARRLYAYVLTPRLVDASAQAFSGCPRFMKAPLGQDHAGGVRSAPLASDCLRWARHLGQRTAWYRSAWCHLVPSGSARTFPPRCAHKGAGAVMRRWRGP